MRKNCIYLIVVIITINVFASFSAEKQKKTVFTIDLKKEIGSTSWIYIQEGFEKAYDANADLVLIHMNTYGGELVYADSIRTKILNSELPVYVFVDNNAASAGALIAIACDKIFMRPGASMGAATVVSQSGERMPDKYQSYMRAIMRATAESHGKDTLVQGNDTVYKWKRDPLIAEAMVDDRSVLPNLIDSGKTLTFSALEAVKYGYCEGVAGNIREVVEEQLKIESYDIVSFRPSAFDNIKGFLMSSVIQGLLVMLIIGGIYFELQTPGVGFPLGVAITAAVLYFAPLYMDGLAANWEIIVFVVGLVLLGFEIFVIPGFGIAGVSGIILIIAGLTLSLLDNVVFDFRNVKPGDTIGALFTVMAGMGLSFGLVVYLSNKIGSKGIFRKMALDTSLDKQAGYMGVSLDELKLIGKQGVTATVLRPSGIVSVEGVAYPAISQEGYIPKGTPVTVIRYETGQIYVEKAATPEPEK
ncbi:MAG TPA: NfeD family protein [Paludibacter sp.]|nr:NfeD family protein [Paludibacter sp.]